MTNLEAYRHQLYNYFKDNSIAVMRDGELRPCNKSCCGECMFATAVLNCKTKFIDWLSEEYKPKVDWSNVPVDTKVILTRGNGKTEKYHFANYRQDKNEVYLFVNGATSWSAANENFKRFSVNPDMVELAE